MFIVKFKKANIFPDIYSPGLCLYFFLALHQHGARRQLLLANTSL